VAWSDYAALTDDPHRVRFFRLVRALLVGAVATAADLAVLTLGIRLLSLAPELARGPALLTGALVQFFGNRRYTFRAERGSLARHARLFLLFEASAYVANLLLYGALVGQLRAIPPELVSFLGTFLIFVTYSYPMRRLVIFRLLRKELLADERTETTRSP
jgi:putative flippase GtrA